MARPDVRRVGHQRIRVPSVDFGALAAGHKTEVRLTGQRVAHPSRFSFFPQPILMVTRSGYRYDRFAVLVLEACWQETLGAITPESLAREGHSTIEDFKVYWRTRTLKPRPWKALDKVIVFRVRPLREGDRETLGVKMVEHLYGEWLDEANGDATQGRPRAHAPQPAHEADV